MVFLDLCEEVNGTWILSVKRENSSPQLLLRQRKAIIHFIFPWGIRSCERTACDWGKSQHKERANRMFRHLHLNKKKKKNSWPPGPKIALPHHGIVFLMTGQKRFFSLLDRIIQSSEKDLRKSIKRSFTPINIWLLANVWLEEDNTEVVTFQVL